MPNETFSPPTILAVGKSRLPQTFFFFKQTKDRFISFYIRPVNAYLNRQHTFFVVGHVERNTAVFDRIRRRRRRGCRRRRRSSRRREHRQRARRILRATTGRTYTV